MNRSTIRVTQPSPHLQSSSTGTSLTVMLCLILGLVMTGLPASATGLPASATDLPASAESGPAEASSTVTEGVAEETAEDIPKTATEDEQTPTASADEQTPTASADEPAATGSGLWIFIDPDTGRQVAQPTPEQRMRLRKFATQLNKSDQGLEPFELEGGGQGVRLNGRFQHAVIATVGPDGTIGFQCTDQSHDHPQSPLHTAEESATTVEATEAAPEQ